MRSASSSSAFVIAALLAAAGSASAQTTTALLREGQELLPGRTINAFSNVYANHVFGFAARVNTTDGTVQQHFWGNATGGPGAILLTIAPTGPYTFSGVEGFFGLSDAGNLAVSPTVSAGAPVASADAVFVNLDTPVAISGEPATVPGKFWSFASRPTMTGTGEVWFAGGVRDTVSGSTSNRGLFRGPTGTPVIIGGDAVGGTIDTLKPSDGIGFAYRVSRLGTNYIGPGVLTGAAATDNAIIFNGALLMAGGSPVREGTVVPTSIGGNGTEAYSSFTDLGVRESGGTLVSASTNAAAATNSILMIDGQIVLREGDLLGGFPITGAIDAADLNEQGDWAVNWAVNNGSAREAIIVNGNMVIKETDPIDFDGDGIADPGVTLTDITGLDCIAISDRRPDGTVDVYFTGDANVGGTPTGALYRISVSVGPACSADFNGVGGVTADDIFAFLDAWFVQNGVCTSICSADFNGIGGVTADDIFAFLDAWFAQNGVCGV